MQKCGDLHQLCQLVLLAQSCGRFCSWGLCLLPRHLVVWFLALRDRFHVDLLSIYSVLNFVTHTFHLVLRPALGNRYSSLIDKEMETQEG